MHVVQFRHAVSPCFSLWFIIVIAHMYLSFWCRRCRSWWGVNWHGSIFRETSEVRPQYIRNQSFTLSCLSSCSVLSIGIEWNPFSYYSSSQHSIFKMASLATKTLHDHVVGNPYAATTILGLLMFVGILTIHSKISDNIIPNVPRLKGDLFLGIAPLWFKEGMMSFLQRLTEMGDDGRYMQPIFSGYTYLLFGW